MSDPTSAVTTFKAPKSDPLGKNVKMKLTVKDHGGLQSTADSSIFVTQNELPNNPPSLTITSPTDGASFDSRAGIIFSGSVSDPEDSDLTGSIVWTSNLDGQIGTGGSIGAILSDGTHTITASVTDSGSLTGNSSVTITVGSGEDSVNLTVTAYKTKGDKHADLTWSGASSTDVDIYRDGSLVTTTANDGAYTHGPFNKGKPATYQVCEAGMSTCSNEVTVSW